jgi:hypothetical protein
MNLTWEQTYELASALTSEGIPVPEQVATLLQRGAPSIYCIKALRLLHQIPLNAGKQLVDDLLAEPEKSAKELLRKSIEDQVDELFPEG